MVHDVAASDTGLERDGMTFWLKRHLGEPIREGAELGYGFLKASVALGVVSTTNTLRIPKLLGERVARDRRR